MARIKHLLPMYLPNTLSWARLIAAPGCVALIFIQNFFYAFILFFLASSTDFFDGWVARRFSTQSSFGSLLDPLADKILLTGVFLSLALMQRIPFWLAILLIGRDVCLVVGLGIFKMCGHNPIIKPLAISKISTFFQILLVSTVLSQTPGIFPLAFEQTVQLITALTLIASSAGYLYLGWCTIKRQGQ